MDQIREKLLNKNQRQISFRTKKSPASSPTLVGDGFKRSICKGKIFESGSTYDLATIWEPMIIEGEFILYWVADTYLLNDFEHSLRISTTDFSFVENSALFEANILRFRALASLKLFQHCDLDNEENIREGYDYLIKAIESM